METIDFKKQLYSMPIIAFYGNDILHIGMPLETLNNILRTYFAVYGEQNNTGFCLTYWIQLEKSIRITLDIIKQQIYSIEFLREYKGKTLEGFGIGTTIKEICDLRSDIYFDEQFVLIGNYPYDFILEIDNNSNTIYNLEDIYSNRVTKITVEDKNLLNNFRCKE